MLSLPLCLDGHGCLGGRTRERLALILAACCTKIKCSGRLRAEKQTRDGEPTRARNPDLPSLEKQKKILVFVYLFFCFSVRVLRIGG